MHCHCDDTTLHGLQVFTILYGNGTRMMRFKERREGAKISRRNEESGSKARPRGRKAAGPVVEERGAGEQADKYFSLDAKKYFPSTRRDIFSIQT